MSLGLGSPCSLQSECSSIPHSTCIDFQCSCISGYQIREDVCAKKVSKKACTTYKDCDSPRICSTRNTCDCPFTMIESDSGVCLYRETAANQRLIPVSLGSYCSDEIKCSGTSKCLNHLCVCPNGTVEHNSQCMPQMTGQLLLSSNDTVSPCPTDGSCKLPNCFCSKTGMAIPGGFRPKEIPQMVILSFDDAITDRTINIYKSLFNGKHRNPNGCPIKGTFFISHQWNNYDQTQWVHSKGNEIAVNSITHETLSRSTKERWRHEMVGLRDSLKAFSYIEDASIKGIRAPQLLLGGDAQFEMMKENGFLYDNSMSVKEGPVWPQTLDHQLAWDCGEQNCPRKAHKGLWEIPLQLLQANDGIWHTMAKTTIKPYDTRDSVRQMLRRNFYRNYKSNRAPFILTADTDFLTYLPDNGVVHAIEDWLEEILNKTDVYVVTTVQAIQWMSDPSSLSNIEKFRPWQCNVRLNDFIHPCEVSRSEKNNINVVMIIWYGFAYLECSATVTECGRKPM
uniref:Prion-like-(Q/N-rich) domain-bearing protein 25 n=1 Tax=Heterorhabditis bacteriophora TaxID=37862 RepID=A0A1I7X0A4_HETBA